MDALRKLFEHDFMPHGVCYSWRPDILWLNVGSDVVIAAAYYSIPLALFLFVQRGRDLTFRRMYWLFAAFILFSGATHILGAVTVWDPLYRLQGWMKFLTAAVSVATAILLWPLLPRVLALPSPAQLARNNALLQAEVNERQRRESELVELQSSLERTLEERTAQLARSNRQLASQAQRLTEADQRKDRFLGVLAHELRSPLVPIRNAAFLLKEQSANEPRQIERVANLIEDQVRQLARLIDDLSGVQRIVDGEIELRPRAIDTGELITSVAQTIGPLIDQHGHRLSISMPERPPQIEADPVRLRQVLTNLLTNAALYTDAGGNIQLQVQEEDGEVVFRVRDNGMGIPEIDYESMFEMFTRTERSIERAKSGLGLGLAVVRRLVELHGGSVSVHSDGIGKGSEFTIRLPAAARLPGAASDSDVPRHDLRGLNILVVDDHKLTADSLCEALRHEGATALPSYSGTEALASLAASLPDVLLLDLGLPDMPGEKVARQVRTRSGHNAPLIVALTGFAETPRPEDGFDFHLVKPVALPDLLKVLAERRR